jgi:hypothetical protein
MDCGHDMEVIDASESPPLFGPWVFLPVDDIDAGTEMTCITCDEIQTVTAVGKDTRENPDSF